jgi:hypothetical protein
MTALSVQPRESIVDGASSVASLRAQIQLIQHAMTEVMIENVHFGKIPGTPKPSLWKSGAEVLCAMFRIAPIFLTDDLSTTDCVRYRVRCIGRHQTSGIDLGEGVGECSSDEAKYKWRSPVCDEEFAATPVDRRREKWVRGSNGAYVQKQVRTEPADIANTVLKMSAKRAHVSMVLNVLAASDCFSQDLEDLPDGVLVEGERKPPQRAGRRPPQQARPRSSGGGGGHATDAQVKLLRARMNDAGMSAEDVCRRFEIDSITNLPFEKVNEALSFIADPERDAIRDPGAETGGEAGR